MKTKIILTAFICLLFPYLSASNRKAERLSRHLEEYGVKSAEELEAQANYLSREGTYDLAITRFIVLQTWFPNYKLPEDTLLLIAGLEYKAGNPKAALASLQDFGEKYPDSPKITQLVSLAYLIGKNYTVEKNEFYKGLSSSTKAIEAFEYVIKHDPYSLEAANSLLSIAILNMKKGAWEDAIVRLKDIHKKQPATDISSLADVYLGECYIRLNKGISHSLEFLNQAKRYLESYQKRKPTGKNIIQVESLLQELYLRMGVSLMKNARYYCTSRKWKAVDYYLDLILKNNNYAPVFDEAKQLKKYVKDLI